MAIKKTTAILLIMVLMVMQATTQSNKEEVTIILPKKSVSGDFITVVFKSKKALSGNAVARLFTPQGKPAGTVKAFYTDKTKTQMAALIGMSIFWTGGNWIIEGEITMPSKVVKERGTLILIKKEFSKEIITMGKRNTAIVKDKSTKKKQQIENFAALLKRQNLDAPVHKEPMVLPLKATRRTGGFADARIYKYSDGTQSARYHWGVDFGVPVGTDVFASGSGRIVFADERITTGFTIAIEHAPGVYSLYYHLNKLLVKTGDTVHASQLIARSGNTGLSTGPHLHWEVRINGRQVSPDALRNKPLF